MMIVTALVTGVAEQQQYQERLVVGKNTGGKITKHRGEKRQGHGTTCLCSPRIAFLFLFSELNLPLLFLRKGIYLS